MIRTTACVVLAGLMFAPAGMQTADAQGGQTYEGGVMRTFVDAIYVQGDGNIIRRGNWTGPGWWGGAEDSDNPGNLPPLDSIDAVAMRHDFGYQIAEEYGKRFNSNCLEQRLKAMADEIAVRDAMALPDNPMDWPMPPPAAAPGSTRNHLADARASRAQIINGFSKLAIARRAGGFVSGEWQAAGVLASSAITGFTLGLLPTWGPAADYMELKRLYDLTDGFFSAENLDKQIQAKVEQWYRQHGQPDAPAVPVAGAGTAGDAQMCGNCGGRGWCPVPPIRGRAGMVSSATRCSARCAAGPG